jgi:hypothetical protein
MNRAQNIDGIRVGLDFVNQAIVVPIPHYLAVDRPGAHQKEEQEEKIACALFPLLLV